MKKTALRLRIILLLTVSVVLYSSCKVSAPVQMPVVKNLPDSFLTVQDSGSVASLPVKQFFSDPNLISLIDSAMVNNPDLLIAMQRIDMARADVLVRRGALKPWIDGVVSVSGDRFGDYTMTGVGNFDTNLSPNINEKQKVNRSFTPDFFVGFRSTWEIDIWGKLKNQRKAAIAQLMATEMGRRFAVTNIVSGIAELYYELMALDYELKIISKNVQLQEEALEVVKVQKEGGRATELAVKQFYAQLLNTKTREFRTKQMIVEVENQLNTLVGSYPTRIARDSSLMEQTLPIEVRSGLPSEIITRRPDIMQAEFELEAAKASVSAARAAFLPSLRLTPYVGFNSFKGNLLLNPGSIAFGLLGGITAPVFNQWQLKAGYQIANAANKEAIFNYQKTLLNGFSEVVTQMNRIDNFSKVFELKSQEVGELSGAVTIARDLYLTGYANYLEIITAQKGVLEAELQLVADKKEIFLATIGLYRALGGGWE